MATKINPGRFDCYGNAAPDEEMFILLARDWSAPLVVRFWAICRAAMILLRIKPRADWRMVREAFQCARSMRRYRNRRRGRAVAKAPVSMSLDRALEIVSAINDRSFFAMGVVESVAPLDNVSLAQMLQAKEMVLEANRAAPLVDGKRQVHVVPADRLIAAAYVMERGSGGIGAPGRRLVIL